MKSINSPSNLAINGAPPAFDNLLHVGRPNIGDTKEFLQLTSEMLERQWLTNNGPYVQELERKLANQLGVKHCIVMCNGTIALEIAIRALGLEGEVIVPSFTFIATAHALYWQGITPVFADISPATHLLDPQAVRRMITPKTTAILAVHLWGNPAPITHLQEIADEYNLKLLFDAAHAFGSSYGGHKIGGFGEAEVFSFHATKFFNTLEGGAVTTNNSELAKTIQLMRNFGFSALDNVIYPGTNGKMTEICAAMGLVNLNELDKIIEINKSNYDNYCAAFDNIDGLSILKHSPSNQHNYQYIVLEVNPKIGITRDEIIVALHAENIFARKYFWPGCHKMKPYKELFPHADFMLPNTNIVAKNIIVLPTGQHLPEEAPKIISDICKILISLTK